ncbi:MAG: 4-hydroxy-tetrahydrodipicolinate synthase [Ilumatobacteraceae bacterium]|jgi:4-hydroxy-tetrahydrodipicolinate synthase|nr:4-hydroxy-tetrahydrodipicolinate synthase [Ilumatobacteraceae bacterium]MDP5069078.1 4-hydroxy-tetrahydrodipicolinate synthase [Ilumatobacteraceae bacterium]
MAIFGQVLTAMITPFDASGALDLNEAVRLAKWLQDNGNDGLVVSGTTGESSTLTDAEKLALWEAVINAVTIPVIAGSGSNDTAHSVHLTKEVTKMGAAGILAVGPYYNRPPQSGLEGHITAMANATTLPVVVYDIPVRTGRKISTQTLAKLANTVPNIKALKDAAGAPAETANLMAQVPKDFELYSGDDGLTLAFLAYGGSGVIGVATHWSAPEHQAMITAFKNGDVALARKYNDILLESYAFETGDDNPNPIPSKVMMNHLGFKVGDCRLPMGPPPVGLADRAATVHANLQKAREALSK